MDYAAEVYSAVVGWQFSADDMQAVCDRLASMLRVFNICEGTTRADDSLAPRTFQPDPSGPGEGKALTREMLDEMLDEYYLLRGWDKDGVPTRQNLIGLGLSEAYERLEKYEKGVQKEDKKG
jgi:aldehyde:ferredoxin oxidoreductase